MHIENSREQGVSLIEMVVVVAIAAILTMIAYPNYSQYQLRARRLDATAALEKIAVSQERFYLANFRFASNLAELGFSSNLSHAGFYVISLPAADAVQFQAVAIPAPGSRQADDGDCQQFTIDNQRNRGATPDPHGKCW
jgi:type IV pilus assembly protein PilE